MSEWRTIDSAPKDGTAFLAYYPQRRGFSARQDCIPVFWSGWGGGCWQNSTSGHHITGDEPSHWQELPDPPKGS